MPFRPGQSGNPAGKPKGPHKTTRDLRKIVNAATPAFARQVIKQAKAGDHASQALFARHLLTRTKINPEPIEIERPKTAAEAAERSAAIFVQIADGTLDFDTAQAMSAALHEFTAALNVVDLERQIGELRGEVAAMKAELLSLAGRPQ
jgi:hypothetical protein